jgi:uncharacterized protein (DUF169 family)
MMSVRQIGQHLATSLGLDSPPIGLALADAPPVGVPAFPGSVPSACTFWRRAERAVFYATSEQHYRCPIGAMVMGFELPAAVKDELMSLVGVMVAGNYIGADEPARIPSLPRKAAGAVYGPLGQLPIEPDFILLWLSPRQAMMMSEAAGACHWTVTNPPGLLGRPACAAIPISAARGGAALSLGCTGMRTYTDIADDRLLAVVSASGLPSLWTALAATLEANRAIGAVYAARKAGAA